MTTLAITGGRLIDPVTGTDRPADVWIADGRIAALGEAPADFEAGVHVDAGGLLVAPGLVDLCVRLREPGQAHKATIASETAAALAGGITSLCCPPDTLPALDTPATVELVRGRSRAAGGARVYPVGALTRGLEGTYLAPLRALANAGCVAVGQAEHTIADTHVLRNGLEYAATLGLKVMLSPCDRWLAHGCVHAGGPAARLGLDGIPAAAETAELERIITLAADTGAAVHVGRLSTADAVDLVTAARADGLRITADAAAHQLHLTEAAINGFNSAAHVRPPLRSTRDRDALRAAVIDGSIDAVCSDHQPHEADAKRAPFAQTAPGISGLDTLLPLVLALSHEDGCDLPTTLARITRGPAEALGLDTAGLGPGAPADLCLFSADEGWVLDRDRMHSRGRNTPFAGRRFHGRVHTTVVDGRVLFRRGEAAQ